MKAIPSIFRKFSTELWYIVSVPLFGIWFMLLYQPGDLVESLDMGRNLFVANVAIIFCIELAILIISRAVYHIFRHSIPQDWLTFFFWCTGEIILSASFTAMYLSLISHGTLRYFIVLGLTMQYTFGITVYPYVIITLIIIIVHHKDEEYMGEAVKIKFYDSTKELKATISSDVILYITAEENYVHIHYMDGTVIKDYRLHNSMNAIGDMTAKAGLYRCHRSYFVNPSHISALRKDGYNSISAELDVSGVCVPVSRKYYQDLTAMI